VLGALVYSSVPGAFALEPAQPPLGGSGGSESFECPFCFELTCRVGKEKRVERICDVRQVKNYLECDADYCARVDQAREFVKQGNIAYAKSGLDITCSIGRVQTYWGTFWWSIFDEMYC